MMSNRGSPEPCSSQYILAPLFRAKDMETPVATGTSAQGFSRLVKALLRAFRGDAGAIDHHGGDALAMECGVAEYRFRGFRAAVIKVNIVFPGETHPAMNLDAAVADGAGGIAGIHLGDGNGRDRIRRILFERPSGVVDSGAGTLGFEVHVGALVLDGLKHADGFAELFSSLGVFDGEVEGAYHAANHVGGERRGGDIEGPRQIRGRADF